MPQTGVIFESTVRYRSREYVARKFCNPADSGPRPRRGVGEETREERKEQRYSCARTVSHPKGITHHLVSAGKSGSSQRESSGITAWLTLPDHTWRKACQEGIRCYLTTIHTQKKRQELETFLTEAGRLLFDPTTISTPKQACFFARPTRRVDEKAWSGTTSEFYLHVHLQAGNVSTTPTLPPGTSNLPSDQAVGFPGASLTRVQESTLCPPPLPLIG